MLRNYLLTAFRNLWRRKGFSFINLTGLAVGMASATLILLWIHNESTYDDFHVNRNRIYMVYNRGVFSGSLQCWPNTPKILGPTLKQEYPGIEEVVRWDNRWFVTDVGDKKMSSHALIVDSTFLNIFTFPLVQGNPNTALNSTFNIVITQSMAKKLFGTEDAMNKIIKIDKNNFTVTGVLKNLPTNTDFDFEFLLPFSYQKVIGNYDELWGNNGSNTIVLLRPNVTELAMDEQIKKTSIRHSKGDVKEELFLHPLSKWHLWGEFENGKNVGGFITTIRLFGVIAAFILLVACINFMNLSTARSEQRAKEVGIRKVAGAWRSLLIGQFLGESLLMALLSGVLALGLVYVSLPAFDGLVGKPLTLEWSNPLFYGLMLLFILMTGLLAGSYPAFFLSSFRPVAVLKGTFKRAHAAVNPRKVLVVLQFSFAILLIICTFIIMQQIRYAQNRATGYDRNGIVYHWLTGDLIKRYPLMKRQLIASGVASQLTVTGSTLAGTFSDTWSITWDGKAADDKTDFNRLSEDEGLVKVAGLKLVQGRDMDLTQYPTDSSAILLNETAVKAMNFRHPIGQIIRDGDQVYHVVGVVADFVINSPFDNMDPMIIEGGQSHFFNVINIRLADPRNTAKSLAAIKKVFQEYNAEYPFEYHFIDDDYQRKFEGSQRIATLTGLFAGLTIFISCLGLFGLAAYMAEARVKEIGIRKVLGASVMGIASLLTKDFLKLVLIALLIASPIAWYTMHNYLEQAQYRVTISVWVFVGAGMISILIALLTVGYQAVSAARTNPVKNLRPE